MPVIDSENGAGPDGSKMGYDQWYELTEAWWGVAPGIWAGGCMKWVIIIVFLVHAGLTVVAHSAHGYSGFFPPFADANTTQIFSDLVIALSMVNMWVFLDLRWHQRPVSWCVLHLLGTAAMGSFAPLIYFLVRDRVVVGQQRG